LVNTAKLPAEQAAIFAEMISKVVGQELSVAGEGKGISLELGKVEGGREAYALKSSKDGVQITANSAAGLLYGVQSLLQVIDGKKVPAVTIQDYPRYAWRGLHLDVSRHFFDVDFVKRYIDLMVMYKYNVFHWHLTDSDGWRIESKKYPKLTEVGAFRPSVGRAGNQAKGLNVDDGKKYGGFYTQEEIKEVVAYAKARNVDVLPEVDVPGHSKAIVLSYPEFGTHPGSDVLNVGNPETITFLEGIFSEVAALFPFEYFHIGCDEVGLGAWMRNADCQAKMKELGTEDPHDLHKWLVEHLQKHLAKEKKEAVAWCEVLDAKVGKDTVVMAWRDNGGWIKAPKLGHKTVVTPSMQTYFNYQEDIGSNAPGHGGYRTIMQKVYNFDPTDERLTDEQKRLVLGGQGCVWTEFIPKPEHVEYITFPRAAALAEALWSPKESKDWEKFQQRIDAHTAYMDQQNIQYRIGAPLPVQKSVDFIDKAKVEFTNPNLRGEICYTIDGSEPNVESTVYPDGGIEVDKPCSVKAIVVYPNGRISYRVEVKVQKAGSGTLGVPMLIETDMPEHRKHVPRNLLDTDAQTYYHSGGKVPAGKQMTIRLGKPVKLSEIEVLTGRENGSDQLGGADLEVSYDGKTFVKLGDFTGGVAKGTPEKPVQAVRIKTIRDHNHWVLIREVNFTK
jgi:hexosaminidase